MVGALGDVHAIWRMKGFKMSVVAAIWESKNALKIRLEEKKTQVSLNSLTNVGEVLYSKINSYYFKDLSIPFIIERAGHKVQEKLTRKAFERSPSNSFYSSTQRSLKRQLSRFFLKLAPKVLYNGGAFKVSLFSTS